MCCLTAGRGGHVEDAFVGKGGEREHGEEGGRGLEDVLAGEVFGGGAFLHRLQFWL